jgi:hypothetical protein
VFRPRDDGSIAFHRDGTVREPEVLDQPAHGEPVRDVPSFTVYDELHQSKTVGVDRTASSD